MNKEEELKQITYELADTNFYREPDRFTELFNKFISLASEQGKEEWKNRLSCLLPVLGFLEDIPAILFM